MIETLISYFFFIYILESEMFWAFMCISYFVGGLTIGWWVTARKYKNKERKTGTGRWDWSNRKFYGEGDQ